MTETIGKILEAENKLSNEEVAKERIVSAKVEARRSYEEYMTLGKYELALFFLARVTAFDECLREL